MRKVEKVSLLCDNVGCGKIVGYWFLFKEYEGFYQDQVRRNGTFYCSSCYHFKKKQKDESEKQAENALYFL